MGGSDDRIRTPEKWLQIERDRTNSVTKPSYKGYDCKQCGNKGFYLELEGEYNVLKECDCNATRVADQNIEREGLYKRFDEFSFSTWTTNTEIDKELLERAQSYIEGFGFGWFYIGGQIGSGKTHIATATLQELMKNGVRGQYYYWSDITTKLKADMNTHEYEKTLRDLTTVPLLFIDDFLKTSTPADLNIAFNIVQRRVDKQLPTIITSEKYLHEIEDEAISSRIKEVAGNYVFHIGRKQGRNYRLKEE